MEVILSPELQAKLTRIARDRGTDTEAVAREAIERATASASVPRSRAMRVSLACSSGERMTSIWRVYRSPRQSQPPRGARARARLEASEQSVNNLLPNTR